MADLAVLVPSRGRPGNLRRLIDACEKTCQADTVLHFGFDDDDPDLEANLKAAAGYPRTVAPRMGLAAWTNRLARKYTAEGLPPVGALASIGDDMVPLTPGWDRLLLEALPSGGGFAYPDDKRRDDIPEAVVISTPIVAALGWMAPCHDDGRPVMDHWYMDQSWADLGRAAECLVYCRHVVVKHMHPNVQGGDPPDQTYYDAARRFDDDLAAYQRWRLHRMRADAAVVRGVRAAAGAAV